MVPDASFREFIKGLGFENSRKVLVVFWDFRCFSFGGDLGRFGCLGADPFLRHCLLFEFFNNADPFLFVVSFSGNAVIELLVLIWMSTAPAAAMVWATGEAESLF